MKIALITHTDASDRRTLSGTPYQIYYLLNRYCGQVTCIDNLIPGNMTLRYTLANWFRLRAYLLFFEFLKGQFWRILGKHYDWRVSLNAARFCARQIEQRLKAEHFDLIWVEKSSIAMPFVKTDIPVIHESDATFHALVDYYPWFTGLSWSALQNGEWLEQTSLRKAAAVVLTADWAKDSAISDYNIEPGKITVLPSPPNCDHVPGRDLVLMEKQSAVCNLLFIGVDWERKGGDVAVGVVEALNRSGIPSRLHVCGCRPPAKYEKNPLIQTIGFLDKNLRDDMQKWERLFLDAHFFILPTRAECMGISFSEAAGFGLPIVATDTGGVSTIVKHNKNGLLFPMNESPAVMAADIRDLWSDRKRYCAMRTESRRFFDEEISSEVWIATVKRIIAQLVPQTTDSRTVRKHRAHRLTHGEVPAYQNA